MQLEDAATLARDLMQEYWNVLLSESDNLPVAAGNTAKRCTCGTRYSLARNCACASGIRGRPRPYVASYRACHRMHGRTMLQYRQRYRAIRYMASHMPGL